MVLFTVMVAIGYLMGSVCSAIIVCRLFALPDPCKEGSKNPGATNVLRIAGKQYALLVLVGDVLKGMIPVLIAEVLGAGSATIGFTALAAVLGHIYPVFFGFKGGKGVATAIGALLGFQFIVGVLVIATWLIVANFSRHSSLASIISICLSPFYSLLLTANLNAFPPLTIIAIVILIKHKKNISRLINGTEPKIKLKQHKDHNIIDEIMEAESNIFSEEDPHGSVKTHEPKPHKQSEKPKTEPAKADPSKIIYAKADDAKADDAKTEPAKKAAKKTAKAKKPQKKAVPPKE